MNPEQFQIDPAIHYQLQQATVGRIADSVLDISFALVGKKEIKLFIYILKAPYAYGALMQLQQRLVKAVPAYTVDLVIHPIDENSFQEMLYERLWHPLFVRYDEDV